MKKNLKPSGVWDAYTLKKTGRIMRCILIFLFASTLNLIAADGFSQKAKISLSGKSASLESVMSQIEKQSEYVFLFSKEVIDINAPIEISVKDQNVEEVLDELFKTGNIEYRIIENKIILSTKSASRSSQQDQKLTVTGKVTDTKGEPIPGVNVFEKVNMVNGVITGIDGSYSISLADPQAVLSFSFIGFIGQDINVAGRSSINITLSEEFQQVDEVLVVAYGTAKKETYTGSAEVVKSEDLVRTSSGTVTKAILGKVAGVQVASYSSAAGDGASIRIRGVGSANAGSDPLYVVDGVQDAPIPNNRDIESFVVLKDAAAASLYGSRAANGVIVITTKTGKGDAKVNVNYNKTLGWKAKDKFDLMNANEFASKSWEGLYNKSRYLLGQTDDIASQYAHDNWGSTIGYNPYGQVVSGEMQEYQQPFDNAGNLKEDAVLLYDTDWFDQVYRQANIDDIHLSISRGGDNGQIYSSLSLYDQESIMIGNDYRKINYTLNASSKIRESIEFGINSSAKYYEGRKARSLWDVYTFNPITPVYERAGITTADYDSNQYNYGDIIRTIEGKNEYHWNEVYYGTKRNPLAEIELYDEGYDGFQVFASPYLRVEPLKGLTFQVKGSAKFTHTNESYFYPPTLGTGETKKGSGSKYDKNWRQLSGFAQATYETKIGAHWLKAMAVYEAEDYQYKWASAAGKEYPMWEIANELGDAVEQDWISSGMYEYSKLSYLASIDYGFADKYYFTASFRRDGSSKFGPDNRWGNFGSLAATWRISEENFIKSLGYINNLKLRVSYGITGNDGIGSDAVGYYMYQGVYGLDGNYNQQKAAYVDGVENRELAWEGNKNGNIALEYKLFDKLWGTVEYYDRRSDRLLLYKRIPYTAGGQSTMSQNIGEIKNSGWELSIGAQIISRPEFNWDLNLTYTANENEILEWYGDNWSGDGQTYRDTGGSMYNLRMKKWAGVDSDTGKPLWYKEVLDGDGNSTGKTTLTNDWEDGSYFDVGNAAPDFFGGITNNIAFKNFDFSFMFYYSVGNYAYNNIKGMVNSDGAQPRFQLEKNINDSWSAPGDQSENPMYVTNDPSSAWWRSTRFLQKSDFLKLKNVTLGYSLPDNVLSKLHLQQCRVFVMGENLWTLTEFTGYDPELSLNGDTNGYVIPPMTSITMGLNLTF